MYSTEGFKDCFFTKLSLALFCLDNLVANQETEESKSIFLDKREWFKIMTVFIIVLHEKIREYNEICSQPCREGKGLPVNEHSCLKVNWE